MSGFDFSESRFYTNLAFFLCLLKLSGCQELFCCTSVLLVTQCPLLVPGRTLSSKAATGVVRDSLSHGMHLRIMPLPSLPTFQIKSSLFCPYIFTKIISPSPWLGFVGKFFVVVILHCWLQLVPSSPCPVFQSPGKVRTSLFHFSSFIFIP